MLAELGIELEEITEDNVADIKSLIRETYKKELDYLWGLPTILEVGNYIFVHAGIQTDSFDTNRTFLGAVVIAHVWSFVLLSHCQYFIRMW